MDRNPTTVDIIAPHMGRDAILIVCGTIYPYAGTWAMHFSTFCTRVHASCGLYRVIVGLNVLL